VKIHEYQAKGVLKTFGVPVPNGSAASTPDEAQRIATGLGTPKVVVKSQIHAGGRGKGRFKGTDLGGVVVTDAAKAGEVARKMLGNVLVTKQSGPEGKEVRRVLVEEGISIVAEYYVALLLDRAAQAPVFIASAEGGTEIEEVAAERPEAIHKLTVSPITGYQPWMGRKLGFALGLKPELIGPFAKMCAALYAAFSGTDASMVEINPMIQTGDGRILALDAKCGFECHTLVEKYQLLPAFPPAVRDLFQRHALEETPKSDDPAFVRARWWPLAAGHGDGRHGLQLWRRGRRRWLPGSVLPQAAAAHAHIARCAHDRSPCDGVATRAARACREIAVTVGQRGGETLERKFDGPPRTLSTPVAAPIPVIPDRARMVGRPRSPWRIRRSSCRLRTGPRPRY
jgi:succinyl-CoA synthetase beta subunit